MAHKIRAIEKGWGEDSIYYSIDPRIKKDSPRRVNRIDQEIKFIGNGLHCDLTMTVYRGYTDEQMVFEMEAGSSITLYFEVNPPKEQRRNTMTDELGIPDYAKGHVTKEQYDEYLKKTLDRLKQDPQYELKREFGMLLMIHINDFTPQQRKRYDELKTLLK